MKKSVESGSDSKILRYFSKCIMQDLTTCRLWLEPTQSRFNKSRALCAPIALLIVTSIMPFNVGAFEDGYKYLKQLDKETQIDWTVDRSRGDSPCLNDNVAEKMGLRCKEITEYTEEGKEIQSTYLRDAQGKVFYAKDLVTGGLRDIGLEYGLHLSKMHHRRGREIFILVNKKGSFKESFSLVGEISIYGIWTGLPHQKNASAYAGWLVVTGGLLKLTPCSQAILDGLENEYLTSQDYYSDYGNYMEGIKAGEFSGNQFMQIELIAMPEYATGFLPVDFDTALKAVINEQMEQALEVASNTDEVLRRIDSAYYLAFLAVNAHGNSMLKELITQYAKPVGERFINIYQHAAACHLTLYSVFKFS